MADVAELIVALRLQDGVSRGLGNLNRELRGMQGGLSQVGRGIGQVGAGLGTIATRGAIAAAGLGTFFVTTAASFEQSEAGIRKTVEGTEAEVDALIDTIKEMSRTIPLSFEELAAIGAEGGALGIATGSLDEFIDVVARLGVSTDLTTDAAATALGHMANVLQLSDADLQDFADSLVALGNKGASTESEILDLATRFGAAGKQAGLSNEAILALASTTSSMGVEAEAGGGALSRIFQGITLDIGTATEESQVLAEATGKSLAELRTAWDHDAGAVFSELLDYINQLDKFEQAQFLSNLGITNVRDINALSLLASGVEQYTEDLETSTGQTNELRKESDAFFNTTAGKWETLKNNVRLAADVVGGELLPVVNEVMDDFVEWLTQPGTQTAVKEFGENLAGGIREFVAEIRKADFGPLIDTLKGAAAIARTAFDAFRSLPAPIQQLALAALVANRVTGGAVGGIAAGLGNIAGGLIKIAFERGGSPLNPLFVQQVGGIGGAPGGAGRAGGAGRLLLGVTGVGLAALLADEFEEEIEGFTESMRDAVFGEGNALINLPSGPSEWQWPFGAANPPDWLPDFLGGPGPDLSNPFGLTPAEGRAALEKFVGGGTRDKEMSKLLLSGFSEARNVTDRSTKLPDTAMLPFVDSIGELTTNTDLVSDAFAAALRKLEAFDQRPMGPPQPGKGPGGFVGTIKLDPSQVTDLREPTRLAWLALLDLKAGAQQADTANRTASNFLATEAIKNRMETSARLTTLASKYDQQVASLNGVNARLDSSNAKLAAIAAKNFSPTIKVENKVSSTVITNNVVQNRTVAGGYVNLPSRY